MEDVKFEAAFDFAFKELDPNDSKLNISKSLLSDLFPEINPSSFELEDVKTVYYERVWIENNLYRIQNLKVAQKVFDFSCNLSPKRGGILLQRSLNAGWDERLVVDGRIAGRTIEATNRIDDEGNSDILEKLICHYAANFYEIFGSREHIKYLLQWVFR